MKTNERRFPLSCLLALLSMASVAAQETAVVKQNHVNVRGQPSLAGEVITQVQKGEKVVVLEEITTAKPKTNEPPKWARIQIPTNTPVWVYGPYIDSNKTVHVSRLNLRAGPGENYSVVGRLPRGAAVTEIRRADSWIEIETPPGAYGFVAANLLAKGAAAEALATAKPPKSSAPAPAVPPPAPEPTTPQNEAKLAPPTSTEPTTSAAQPSSTQPSPPVVSAPPEKAVEEPPPVASAPAVTQPQTAPPPVVPSPTAPVETPAPTTAASEAATSSVAKTKPDEPIVHRVVRREGIVRSTVSIQAPTYYELLSPENHKTINYLHVDKLDLDLKDYRGRRIIVTGEEAIDPRWKKTPVIEVDHLELIP